jgi:hypothetical protein
MKRIILRLLAVTLPLLLVLAWYEDSHIESPLQENLAPPAAIRAERPAPNPLRNAYFGELHLHSAASLDATVFGTRGGPRTAYRFARGESVQIPANGKVQRLQVPLDFAAVTDHAEGLGVLHQCYTRDSGSYWVFNCIAIRHRILLAFPRMFASLRQDGHTHASYDEKVCGPEGSRCIAGAAGVWKYIQDAAEDYYSPGYFTTFKAFEFSPTLVDGGMLHRNIIFRSSVVPANVFASQDGFPEDLLRWLASSCSGDCRALSIPHNPNFSWGLMFADTNSDGTPLTRENVELRARIETSVEIFQAKGSSECASLPGSNDEECGFEQLWPACDTAQLAVNPQNGQHTARCEGANDLVRGALRKGLLAERKWGINPYKYGIIAATDNHNATPGDTAEATFNGHSGVNDGSPEQRLGIEQDALARLRGRQPAVTNPGGLAGVWAEENTREAVWDALERKESFGTSGTRIKVRVFGGYGFPEDFHLQHDAIAAAYARGVPMGGDLSAAPGNAAPASVGDIPVAEAASVAEQSVAPAFAVWALRDPNSAPLQRIQIVKGWAHGDETEERVYDVACSDGLYPDPQTQRCPDNGATVNLADCSISADKGAAELATTWTDPDFDAAAPAFYYVRVLENPVCRYSQRDALALAVAHPDNVPQTIQERAWSSPIWYSPQPQTEP